MNRKHSDSDPWAVELSAISAEGRTRSLRIADSSGLVKEIDGRSVVDFSSNDYLGLSRNPEVVEAACEATRSWGTGSGASRLVSGTSRPVTELEEEIAAWKGAGRSLVFGSGYLANLAVIQALLGSETDVFFDRLSHASLIDGVRMSGLPWKRYRHDDLEHLETLLRAVKPGRKSAIVTESVFSMEGDLIDLQATAELARRHGAVLIVDEAHATGLYGRSGEGRTTEFPFFASPRHLVVGTFGKALGNYGAYVSGHASAIELLVQKARPFMFSTALPPGVIAGTHRAIRWIRSHPEEGRGLRERSREFRRRLQQAGMKVPDGDSPILPLLIGENERTVEIGRLLFESGHLVGAIRPPTVEPGSARLRISLQAGHEKNHYDGLFDSLVTHLVPSGES